ncbi:MAG: hypothetical protein AAF654_00370 [Myxococcota bacterium]
MKMTSNSRRRFLTGISRSAVALALRPDRLLFNAILASSFHSARAEAAGLSSARNYININMGGGPPRYMSDHWLRTRVDDPALTENPYTATSFRYDSNYNVVGFEHRTFAYNGVLVPNLFSALSSEERSRFLDSFVVIRGYGTGIDGHGLNSALQQHPLASAPSIAGHIADYSERTFQAVQYPAKSGRFSSRTGVSTNKLRNADPLRQLLGALTLTNRTRQLSQSNSEAFAEVRSALNGIPEPTDAVRLAKENLSRSQTLLNSSLGDFESEWPPLLEKYDVLVHDTIRSAYVPGVTSNHERDQQLTFIVDDTDVRFDTGTSDGYLADGSNICLLGERATMGIAARFALAEYCLKNNLVSALEVAAGSISGLGLAPGNASATFDLGNDMHGAGGYVAFVAMSLYHLGIFKGVLELSYALERAGIWQDTVVHFTSEFDRSVGHTAGGSGHGTEQMIASVLGGAIQGGPYVAGNVSTFGDGRSPSQGVAHAIEGYANERPNPIMMASTVCELMRVDDNPWRNFAAPLVKENPDGTLSLPFGPGKLVEL